MSFSSHSCSATIVPRDVCMHRSLICRWEFPAGILTALTDRSTVPMLLITSHGSKFRLRHQPCVVTGIEFEAPSGVVVLMCVRPCIYFSWGGAGTLNCSQLPPFSPQITHHTPRDIQCYGMMCLHCGEEVLSRWKSWEGHRWWQLDDQPGSWGWVGVWQAKLEDGLWQCDRHIL